jgi:nicotinamide-nucleotide amidase
MFPQALTDKAQRVLDACQKARRKLALAESCTGGLVSASLTALSGSSAVVERGFVTYSNEAKQDLLGVPEPLLRAHGAVSAEVAGAMAQGALAHAKADLAVAITGIAGPTGGTADKPVGLVFLATASQGGETRVERHVFSGDRTGVRLASAERALAMLLERVESH